MSPVWRVQCVQILRTIGKTTIASPRQPTILPVPLKNRSPTAHMGARSAYLTLKSAQAGALRTSLLGLHSCAQPCWACA
jgi:hypothetical protein